MFENEELIKKFINDECDKRQKALVEASNIQSTNINNLDDAISKAIDIVSAVQGSHVKLITVVRDIIKRIEPEIVEQGKKLKAFDEMFLVEVEQDEKIDDKYPRNG